MFAPFRLSCVLVEYFDLIQSTCGAANTQTQTNTNINMSDSIVLRYFELRGKAEAIRLLFEMAGVEYTEERFTATEWRQGGKKQEYMEKGISSYGQVPVVSVNDKHMSQTLSIMRYFAKLKGCYGDDAEQQYTCDMLVDGVEDWRNGHVRLVYNPDFQNLVGDYIANSIPASLTHFETYLSKKYSASTDVPEKVFLVGEKWSWADIMLLDMLENIVRLDAQVMPARFPLLNKFHEQFKNEPAIKKYFESGRRPILANNSGNA